MKRSVAGLAAILFALGAGPLAAEQAGPQTQTPDMQAAGPSTAAPAGAIPGVYDPVARAFKPLAAPSAAAKNFAPDINFKVVMHFVTSTALDYPTVGCIFSARYIFPTSGVAASGSLSQSASIQFDAKDPPPTETLSLRFTSDESAPRIYLNIQCTAYDINNVGHFYQFQKTTTLRSTGPIISETLGLTVP